MKITTTTVPKDLVAKVENKVLETYIKTEDIWQRQFELPSLQFDLRGRCAGRAYIHHIRLNPVLLIQNDPDFIEETVPHEIAHLITNRLHGFWIKPHGREWKSVMVALGLQPIRCHNYDVSNAQVRRMPQGRRERRFTYACACRTVQESTRTHLKLQSGKKWSACSLCGAYFQFLNEGEVVSTQLPSAPVRCPEIHFPSANPNP